MRLGSLLVLLVTAAVGWAGAAFTIAYLDPALVGARLALFAGIFVGCFGSSAFVFYLGATLSRHARRTGGNLAIAVALGFPLAAALTAAVWLQSLRALTLPVALVLLALLIVSEFALMPRRAR